MEKSLIMPWEHEDYKTITVDDGETRHLECWEFGGQRVRVIIKCSNCRGDSGEHFADCASQVCRSGQDTAYVAGPCYACGKMLSAVVAMYEVVSIEPRDISEVEVAPTEAEMEKALRMWQERSRMQVLLDKLAKRSFVPPSKKLGRPFNLYNVAGSHGKLFFAVRCPVCKVGRTPKQAVVTNPGLHPIEGYCMACPPLKTYLESYVYLYYY